MDESSRAVDGPLEPTVKRQAMPAAGPWVPYVLDKPLSEIPAYVGACIAASGGTDFFFVGGQHEDGGPVDICHVGNGKHGAANARLIAAAPDLLDVVQALVLAQQRGCDPALIVAEDSPLMDAARDALLKVCGVPAA